MTRFHYNAEAWTEPDGTIDFGASVPFGAQVRRKIHVEKRTGYHVQCFRDASKSQGHCMDYEGDDYVLALIAFEKAQNSGHFRYITLTQLDTNTIIKDHSSKDTNP